VVWIPSVEYIEVLLEDQIKKGHLMNRNKGDIPFQTL